MNKLANNCVLNMRSTPLLANFASTLNQKQATPTLLEQVTKVTDNFRQALFSLAGNALFKPIDVTPSAAFDKTSSDRVTLTESPASTNDKVTTKVTNVVPSEQSKGPDHESDESRPESKDKVPTRFHPIISRSLLKSRCRQIVDNLNQAQSTAMKNQRLQDLCNFALTYPDSPSVIAREGGVRALLNLQSSCHDSDTLALLRQSLSAIGHAAPPSGKGVRLLSIDGGGTKGLVILEVLRHLEKTTERPIHQLFDLICGVSTGAILATLLGTLHLSIDECERIYKETSAHMFEANIFSGTSRLLLRHAYYDTEKWESILKQMFTDKALIETSQSPDCPKVVIISALMNTPRLQPFAFRNYNLPDKSLDYYESSCQYRVWEAIRASAAAPGYFEEFILDGFVHQDGGVLINNPAAIAIHEAQLLWPGEPIQACISIGSGKFTPTTVLNQQKPQQTSLMTKIARLIDSATDTEGVHRLLQDLLPAGVYYRLNPTLTSNFSIDEIDPEKLSQMKLDALMYLRKNEYKLNLASQTLLVDRGYVKRSQDWIRQQTDLLF
jgi:calcium-independent phospholipase A2-gamma